MNPWIHSIYQKLDQCNFLWSHRESILFWTNLNFISFSIWLLIHICLECNKSLSNKEEIALDKSIKNKDVFCNLLFCTGFYHIYRLKKKNAHFWWLQNMIDTWFVLPVHLPDVLNPLFKVSLHVPALPQLPDMHLCILTFLA